MRYMKPSTDRLGSLEAVVPTERVSGLAAVVGLLAILPAFTNLRIGSLQPEDFALLLLLGFCVAKFLCSGFSLRIAAGLRGLFKSYSLLLLLLFVLSVLSTRLSFFPLLEVSFLKRPVLFSLSKLLQFAAVVYAFLWLTNVLMTEKKLLARAMSAYWLTGLACCFYAIVCYFAVAIGHLEPSPTSLLGAYANEAGVARARGFFNEGGPFGIYIASVFTVGLLRRHTMGRRLGKASSAVLLLAFFLSASKAGFFAAAFLFLYSVLSAASLARKASYLILSIALFWGVAVSLNFGEQLYGYVYSFENIGEQVASRGADLNLVAGRVSALYIVPRMIAAHPVTGIGFGNYPLMRNDPRYLGILPAIPQIEDVPGIGIPGIAAEIGIPATLWLMLLLFTPPWLSRKQASILGIAAVFQPLAHTFAVQLTFFYPWFVSACAIAASSYERRLTGNRVA